MKMRSILVGALVLAAQCGTGLFAQETKATKTSDTIANDDKVADTGVLLGEPELLMVGDEPLNEDGQMMHPSPAIFDVDNDGANELVIGTIFGGVYASENTNDETGDPVWTEPVVVNTADGEPLKLHNW